MVEIILVSHGNFAKAMLESAELIVGEQDHIQTFGLQLGDSVDQLQNQIAEAVDKALENGEVLVLTDMFSGSPFNATFSLMQHYSFQHITGINLPILLEILTTRDSCSAEALSEMVMEKGKNTIVNVNKFVEEMSQ